MVRSKTRSRNRSGSPEGKVSLEEDEMVTRPDKGLKDVPVPCYLDLDGVSAKELNIGIRMLKERNHEPPSFWTFLEFKQFPLQTFLGFRR